MLTRLTLVTLLATLPGFTSAVAQDRSEVSLPPDHPVAFPLFCRGGGPFVFDTLRQMDGVPIIEIAMRFPPGGSAALSNGTELAQGTCAWSDRALDSNEPALIRFTMLLGDSTGPQHALRDPGSYWRFMVHNTGQGHLESDSHGAWTREPAPTSRRSAPFPLKYLPVMALGGYMIFLLTSRLSAWQVVADRYPAVVTPAGTRIRCRFLTIGRSRFRSVASLTADATHLHVSLGALWRPGYPPFSVPWSDITAMRDEWRWSIVPVPMIRLGLARTPEVRVMIRPRVAEKVVAASGGRLRLAPAGQQVAPVEAGPPMVSTGDNP